MIWLIALTAVLIAAWYGKVAIAPTGPTGPTGPSQGPVGPTGPTGPSFTSPQNLSQNFAEYTFAFIKPRDLHLSNKFSHKIKKYIY